MHKPPVASADLSILGREGTPGIPRRAHDCRRQYRKLTIYNGRGAFKKSPPQILLQGNWLEQAGFSAGDKITVKCQQGQITITKDGTRVNSEE